MSDDAEGFAWKEVAAEKDASVKEVELDKKAVEEKDVNEDMTSVDDSKK